MHEIMKMLSCVSILYMYTIHLSCVHVLRSTRTCIESKWSETMSASTEGTLRVDKTKVESMLPLLKEAADKLREENYVETRVAVLDVMREGMRVEYFRGKDFARYWEKKPGELAYYLGKTDEDEEPKSAEEIQKMTVMLMCYLITAGLLKAAERRHTKPRPGKKKLSKWPTQLITVQVRRTCVCVCAITATHTLDMCCASVLSDEHDTTTHVVMFIHTYFYFI